jgi:hypothetical protein
LFLLKGPEGTVQFRLFTNWHLPHVTKENAGHLYDAIGGDAHWMERPMPADLGYHSRTPRYDGHTPMPNPCDHLDGAACYYDGSTLNAEPVFERLLTEGDEGVWKALEGYYIQTFGANKEPSK